MKRIERGARIGAKLDLGGGFGGIAMTPVQRLGP